MTPDRVDVVRRLAEQCRNLPGIRPVWEMIEHVEELQSFVRDLAAHMEREPGPMKVAEYFQLRGRAVELRGKIGTKTKEVEQQ